MILRKTAFILVSLIFGSLTIQGCATHSQPTWLEQPVQVRYSRQEIESKWRARIQSFLSQGQIPLVDLQSSIKRGDAEWYLADALQVMDELGVALIAFDGRKAPRKSKKQKGYRWGYYIHKIVNAYPDRFILATNGGTNKNWTRQKNSYVNQLIDHVLSGDYPIMGEIEFRHYMSNRQCKQGRTDRDVDIPLNSENGHKIFRLSQETSVAFVIHLEPEDAPLDALEEMLRSYPKAKVIVAHFGQIRHPEKEKRFGPALVRRLLSTYPNLYYDISTGYPGRRYKCNDVLDTVIWEDGPFGSRKSALKPEYKNILTQFSDRFVVGFDYGGGRGPLSDFLKKQVENVRLILQDLPDETKHNIGYRNAWNLLTGKDWEALDKPNQQSPQIALAVKISPESSGNGYYTGIISDGHGHFKGADTDPDERIRAMDRNNVDKVVIWVKHQGGWTDENTLEFYRRNPDRVVPGIAFQNKGWREQGPYFMLEVRRKAASGQFNWLGEVSVRGKIGGSLNAPPDSPMLRGVLDISVQYGLPVTFHHNPYEETGGTWVRTDEFEQFVETLSTNPGATVIWAHWCGLSPSNVVRSLLERFHNLHCDLAWLHKPQHLLPNRLVDEGKRFLPPWEKLIEDFPDRFLMGIDASGNRKSMRKYDKRVMKIRTALGGLKPDVARKIATENFHRIANIQFSRR